MRRRTSPALIILALAATLFVYVHSVPLVSVYVQVHSRQPYPPLPRWFDEALPVIYWPLSQVLAYTETYNEFDQYQQWWERRLGVSRPRPKPRINSHAKRP